MKGYNLYYNEETRELSVREFEVGYSKPGTASGYDFTYVKDTNLYDDRFSFNLDKHTCEQSAKEINNLIASGEWLIRKCKDCGSYFLINDDEKQWFIDHNLSLPKRCHTCRGKRRG